MEAEVIQELESCESELKPYVKPPKPVETRHTGQQVSLSEVKEVIKKWLYITDDKIIDIILAVYIANRFGGDPLWLMLIAPPSSSKTELLRAYTGHKNSQFISMLTPSTLVSGLNTKKGEPSLLPKLNDKLVVLKDFTSILSMRSESQQEVIGQLRECYDGAYNKIWGNGKVIDWSGKFGLIAACTPVWDSHYGVIGAMGERFLLYRSENIDGIEMGMQAQRTVGKEKQMRTDIQKIVHGFINQFDDVDIIQFDDDADINQMIVTLANFCAYARCPVERDRYDRSIKYHPIPEGPARLTKQFMQIGRALSVVNNRSVIDGEVYQTIKKIGRDLMPTHRLRLLQHLWKNKVYPYFSEWQKTTDIADKINLPGRTAKLVLENLMVVGLLNRKRSGDAENSPYNWQLSETAFNLIGAAEVFQDES